MRSWPNAGIIFAPADELAQAGSEAARAEVLKAHPRFPALEAR